MPGRRYIGYMTTTRETTTEIPTPAEEVRIGDYVELDAYRRGIVDAVTHTRRSSVVIRWISETGNTHRRAFHPQEPVFVQVTR